MAEPRRPDADDDDVIDVLRDLLPPGVVGAVEPVDDLASGLWPAEEPSIERAVPARRAQFAAGRRAARRVLALLGREPVAIARGARGEPRWPVGVVGSIAHTESVAVAVAASSSRGTWLGVDLETQGALPPPLWRVVFSARECLRLEEAPELATVAFAAKEAAFKAWFPATGRDLDYLEAEVRLDQAGTAIVRPTDGSASISVGWRSREALVVAVATMAG